MSDVGEESSWLRPSVASPLTGSESFRGVDATVADFWSWAFSDLRDNTTRGILAEFLIAKAVGDTRGIRVGWANHDVQTPDGTRIEVKTSAYLQGWSQRKLSALAFGRLKGLEFYPERNAYSEDVQVRADVFVFAVQTQTDPSAYDMLDVDHWRFWVVRAEEVRDKAGKSVGIGWVREHALFRDLRFDELAAAVQAASG